MKIKNEYIIPAVIIGLGFILSMAIGSQAFLTSRGFDNTLAVTGSAKQNVVADSATWSFSLSHQAYESGIQKAYASLATDLAAAKKFLADNGVADADISVTPVFTDEQYKYGSDQSGPRQFTVRQTITVQSKDPQAIDKLSKATGALTSKGVLIMSNQPQYYYSKLAELRVSMLGAAITDARARADEISSSAKTKVGALKSASSGVVQVLSRDSVDVSDYGQYDTSTIDKTVMVTVRATFFVK